MIDRERTAETLMLLKQLHPGRRYSVRVYSGNQFGYEVDGCELNVTPLASPIVVVSQQSGHVISLSWCPVTSANKYLIERLSDDGDGVHVVCEEVFGCEYMVTGLRRGHIPSAPQVSSGLKT